MGVTPKAAKRRLLPPLGLDFRFAEMPLKMPPDGLNVLNDRNGTDAVNEVGESVPKARRNMFLLRGDDRRQMGTEPHQGTAQRNLHHLDRMFAPPKALVVFVERQRPVMDMMVDLMVRLAIGTEDVNLLGHATERPTPLPVNSRCAGRD
jgi:hypothetical protein